MLGEEEEEEEQEERSIGEIKRRERERERERESMSMYLNSLELLVYTQHTYIHTCCVRELIGSSIKLTVCK